MASSTKSVFFFSLKAVSVIKATYTHTVHAHTLQHVLKGMLTGAADILNEELQ